MLPTPAVIVPLEHVVQTEAAAVGLYELTPHIKQSDAEVLPVFWLYLPAVQSVQYCKGELLPYVPAGHVRHCELLKAPNPL